MNLHGFLPAAFPQEDENSTLLEGTPDENRQQKIKAMKARYSRLSDEEKRLSDLQKGKAYYEQKRESSILQRRRLKKDEVPDSHQNTIDRKRRRRLEDRNLLDIPLDNATPEELQEARKVMEQRNRKTAQQMQKLSSLSEEKRRKYKELKAAREKKARADWKNAVIMATREVGDPFEQSVSITRNSLGHRNRRLEERRLLSIPYDKATPEELEKARLIVERRAEKAAREVQKYHSLSEEEKKNFNRLKAVRAKMRKEKQKQVIMAAMNKENGPCPNSTEQFDSDSYKSGAHPKVNASRVGSREGLQYT